MISKTTTSKPTGTVKFVGPAIFLPTIKRTEEEQHHVNALKEAGLVCSFCEKHACEVEHLVQGPGVNICDECVDVCNEVIKQRKPGQP